ncbi:MAG: ABC transporter ATP-binding protein [Acidimicrobiales bacterium]|nr:ABC transporter ATP-binding protein [Acidimicrobiales bacterium]
MALTVEDIWKTFAHGTHPQTVLRGVDMHVQPGELVALIGHSGCGKSTLLKAIGGLLPIDQGSVSLDGKVVTEPGPDRAMVFQQYSLLPRLSLVDNVRYAVRAARPDWGNGRADAASERYLTAVGLWEHKDKRPAQVSGGMQQRTAVARAFAVEPRALLLDEPFGALDALTRARLQSQLIDLWQSESDTEIVVMVTHGIDEAILLSDRIVVMGNAPGPSVIDVIPVELPRPRDRVSIIDDPHFRQVQQRLLDILMNELEPAA